jgi:hypothetical protein
MHLVGYLYEEDMQDLGIVWSMPLTLVCRN